MYAACGAVSKADHEKLQADLDAATEAQQETKDDLKKESKQRKEAEKQAEEKEAEVADLSEAKDKLEGDQKKVKADAEKKGGELEKIKKSIAEVKANLEAEQTAAAEAKKQLAGAEERAEKAESELATKVKEAEELALQAEATKVEAETKQQELSAREEAIAKVVSESTKKTGGAKVQKPVVWANGLCSCCKGGKGLCLKTFCCPCVIVGKLNVTLKLNGSAPCPGGCPGGCCLGCCCLPCYMCKAAPAIAKKSGTQESKCNACLCTTCCPCCYLSRVHRETLKEGWMEGSGESPKSDAPLQETMGEGGEGAEKATPAATAGTKWSTGLCKCCAQPGGVKLCCKAMLCPCLVTCKLNQYLIANETGGTCPGGGCLGGCCCGCLCLPCFMRRAAPAVAVAAGKEEGKCRACMCGMCCPCCYLEQVFRETLIMTG